MSILGLAARVRCTKHALRDLETVCSSPIPARVCRDAVGWSLDNGLQETRGPAYKRLYATTQIE